MSDIDFISSNIFISSLETANDISVIRKNSINTIISLGCEVKYEGRNDFHMVSYPRLLDLPEVRLASVLQDLIPHLVIATVNKRKVLIHCVQGQSRSVSVIIICLCLMHKMKLEDCLQLIKKKRPSICINPGFLCQLYCLLGDHYHSAYAEMIGFQSIFLEQYLPISINNQNNHPIFCRKCDYILAHNNDVVSDIHFDNFLERHVDAFWKEYPSSYLINQKNKQNKKTSKKRKEVDDNIGTEQVESYVTLPIQNHIVTRPLEWMKQQLTLLSQSSHTPHKTTKDSMSSSSSLSSKKLKSVTDCTSITPSNMTSSTMQNAHLTDPIINLDHHLQVNANITIDIQVSTHLLLLYCPQCRSTCGHYKKNSLLLCHNYLLTDLYALNMKQCHVM